MKYTQFTQYLKERAKKLKIDASLHKSLMTEEEDALEWRIATEILENWLGLRKKV